MSQLMATTKPTSQNSPGSGAAPVTARPLVLLLEADDASAEAIGQLLEHYECEVKHARSILEAMPLLPMVPKFAILDLVLPDGGGDRILDLIRKRKLDTKVVILTACRDREKLKEVARLKPDLILTKPLDFFRLLEFMRASL